MLFHHKIIIKIVFNILAKLSSLKVITFIRYDVVQPSTNIRRRAGRMWKNDWHGFKDNLFSEIKYAEINPKNTSLTSFNKRILGRNDTP